MSKRIHGSQNFLLVNLTINFSYRGEHIQFVQSFKYLGIDVPATNKWSACFDSRLQAGWKSYYLLENQCNQSDTCESEVKLMLFNAMVT